MIYPNSDGGKMPISFSTIPIELQEREQWVLWKTIERDGKETKMPFSVTGAAASSTNQKTWSSFDSVVGLFNESQHSGIGFVFSKSDPFCGIDLDGCRDPQTGTVADWALTEVERFASYCEVSPSGTGLKIWIEAETQLPKGRNKKLKVPEIVNKMPGVECYSQSRYFAVTGNVFRQFRTIEKRESEFKDFLAKHWPETPAVNVGKREWRSADSVIDRARKYVATILGAVSGSGGHNETFRVACVVVRGFDIPTDQAFDVLAEWNETCQPPWSEHELRHKIDSAEKASGERGYLRQASPERWDSIPVPEHRPAAENRKPIGHHERAEHQRPATHGADAKRILPSFAGIDAADLAHFADQKPDWLVEGIFTIDEPLLVGARSKACKTLQLTDLAVAVAVANGAKWMNCFEVPKRRKVLFITGEANYRRASQHIRKALRVRELNWGDVSGYLRVEAVEFPCLPRHQDQAGIRANIEEHGIELVIVDPLYRGLVGVDPTRLAEMGDAIKGFQAACAPAMVALSHHVVKSAAREYGKAPALEDMTGAGIAESCGQWWLVGRNEEYQYNGKHDLCITFGGREGQGGARRILFNEAEWQFNVDPWHEYRTEADEERQRKKEDGKRDAESRRMNETRSKIVQACRNIKKPTAKTVIRDASGKSGLLFESAFGELVRELLLVQRPYRDACNRMKSEGYMLAEYAVEFDREQGV